MPPPMMVITDTVAALTLDNVATPGVPAEVEVAAEPKTNDPRAPEYTLTTSVLLRIL